MCPVYEARCSMTQEVRGPAAPGVDLHEPGGRSEHVVAEGFRWPMRTCCLTLVEGKYHQVQAHGGGHRQIGSRRCTAAASGLVPPADLTPGQAAMGAIATSRLG